MQVSRSTIAKLITAGVMLAFLSPLNAILLLDAYLGQRQVVSITGATSTEVTFQGVVNNYQPSIRHDAPLNQFEVGLYSGEFILRQTDFFIPGPMPIAITRTWHATDTQPRAFGTGTNHPYDICTLGNYEPDLYGAFSIMLEDGIDVPFRRVSAGKGFADAVFRHEQTSSDFESAQINWNGHGWTLRFRDLTQVFFPDSWHGKSSWWGAPIEIRDGLGHSIRFQRAATRSLTRLTGPTGHGVSFQYDPYGRVTSAKDDFGNTRRYGYDSTGHLSTVADSSRILYRFVYEPLAGDDRRLLEYVTFPGGAALDHYLMTHILGADDHDLVQIAYKEGRVSSVKLANGSTYRYDYKWGYDERVHATSVVSPDGRVSEFKF
jgi:YD repeat-containing protein